MAPPHRGFRSSLDVRRLLAAQLSPPVCPAEAWAVACLAELEQPVLLTPTVETQVTLVVILTKLELCTSTVERREHAIQRPQALVLYCRMFYRQDLKKHALQTGVTTQAPQQNTRSRCPDLTPRHLLILTAPEFI